MTAARLPSASDHGNAEPERTTKVITLDEQQHYAQPLSRATGAETGSALTTQSKQITYYLPTPPPPWWRRAVGAT